MTLQNIATEENDIEITISYPGGTYLLEKRIPAGETTMVSINELQQLQTPDQERRRIPADAAFGGLNIWSRNLNNGLVINAMTMNPVTKTCGSCGATGYVDWYALTDSYGCTSGFQTYAVGQSVTLMMSIHWSTSNCSYENPQLNSSSNTAVVNMSLQAVGVGSSNLQATSYQSYPRDISCSSYYHLTSNGAVQAVCAVPTNFHQVGSGTDNGGVLHFEYAWASSTGNLAQLSQCTVGEIVTYPAGNPYTWPNPPWSGSSNNPAVIDLAATTGNFGDDHEHSSFVKPYQTSAFTATQYYRYRCPCSNSGNYVNLLGPLGITRAVNQNGDGTWRYTVTKSGSTATINPLP